MTARLVNPMGGTAWQLECDATACRHTFRSLDRRTARYPSLVRAAASVTGWTVRPVDGQGSRTAPDFCCDHRPPP